MSWLFHVLERLQKVAAAAAPAACSAAARPHYQTRRNMLKRMEHLFRVAVHQGVQKSSTGVESWHMLNISGSTPDEVVAYAQYIR